MHLHLESVIATKPESWLIIYVLSCVVKKMTQVFSPLSIHFTITSFNSGTYLDELYFENEKRLGCGILS